MNKTKSFLVLILLFSLLFCLQISKVSAASTYLSLTSTPTGAAVYKNGSYTYHVTPYTMTGLTAGVTYTLTFKKTGYVTKTASLRAVTGGSKLALALSVAPSLSLTSTPSGAAVYLNGSYTSHVTPYTMTGLTAGTTYTLSLKKTGYVTTTASFRAIAGGAALTMTLSLPPSLSLTSTPTGATVYVNGVKQASLTPCTFKAAVPGTSYALTFSKAGYVTQMAQITATPTTAYRSVNLTKTFVFYVTSSPSGATVYINNVKQASLTPCNLTGYAYGATLNLQLNKPGYLSFSKSFSAGAPGTSYISAKLLILPAPTAVVPTLQYASTTATESKAFAWTYAGTAYTWNVQAPSDLLLFSRAQPAYLASYFALPTVAAQQAMLSTMSPLLQSMLQECWQTSYGDYISWTLEPKNTAYVAQLATRLNTAAKTAGYDYFHEAEFVLNFVNSAVPYWITPSYQRLPAQTLFEGGKCVEKSTLLASLLKALGYKVALFGFPYPSGSTYTGHETVGVAFTTTQMTQTAVPGYQITYYPQSGRNYYFAEPSGAGYWLGQSSTPQIPLIYPLN